MTAAVERGLVFAGLPVRIAAVLQGLKQSYIVYFHLLRDFHII
jgi:hypothetical protein